MTKQEVGIAIATDAREGGNANIKSFLAACMLCMEIACNGLHRDVLERGTYDECLRDLAPASICVNKREQKAPRNAVHRAPSALDSVQVQIHIMTSQILRAMTANFPCCRCSQHQSCSSCGEKERCQC